MRKKPILIALAAIGLSGVAHAQYPVSPQQGILPVTIIGNPSPSDLRFTAVGAPFVYRTKAHFAAITATGSSISTSGTPAFGDFTTLPHSVVVLSGTNRGRAIPIVANSASTLTLASNLPPLPGVGAGAEFDVVQDWTLETLIGSNAPGSEKALPSGWIGGGTPGTNRDRVFFSDGGVVTQAYYNTTSNQWIKLPSTPIPNKRIPLGNGVFVQRSTAVSTSLTLDITGELWVGQRAPELVDSSVPANVNSFLANPNASTTTVGALGASLITAGFKTGINAGNVDRMLVVNSGTILTLYYDTNGNGSNPNPGWYTPGPSPIQFDSTSIAPGAAVGTQLVATTGTTPIYPIYSQEFTP